VRWENVTDGNYTIEVTSPDGNSVIRLTITVDVPATIHDIVNPVPITDVSVGTQIYQIPANISGGSEGMCEFLGVRGLTCNMSSLAPETNYAFVYWSSQYCP